VFIAVKGILNAEAAIVASGGHFTVADIFANRIFRNIVLSLVATFGLWLIASFMFFEVSFAINSTRTVRSASLSRY
jgi:chitin synthase